MATPGLQLSATRVALGAPVEMTYRFAVQPDAPPFPEDYRVMLHVVDADGELMWTDDHDPPTPTRQWQPGQVVEYTRTVFFPVYPYLGTATLEIGLYSTTSGVRLTLAGEDSGQRAYRVGSVELLPQTENVFLVYREGWHQPETSGADASVEWQWTKKDAWLSVRNPRRDAVFYLHADQAGTVFTENQLVTITVGGQPVDEFTITPRTEVIRKVALSASQLGGEDTVQIGIHVDKTFVPAQIAPGQAVDPRELGLRVFHTFVQPK